MIPRYVFLIFMFYVLQRSSVTASPNVNGSSEFTAENGTAVAEMCKVCSCEGRTVNCDEKELTHHFNVSQWPAGPFEEVSFIKNKLVHLKAFPNETINKLVLRENSITKIDDETFKELRDLVELDLSHNQLTSENLGPHNSGFAPESYQPLIKLTILRLSYNDLHTLDRDLFEHMKNLKQLFLAGNPFSVIDYSTEVALSSLAYLEELDLSYCRLSTLPEHLLHSPRFLKKVNLNANEFTTPPQALKQTMGLESISLDKNPIKVLNINSTFPELPYLKELSLCQMPNLTKIGAGAFSGLISLEILHVQGCPQLREIDENALVRTVNRTQIWPQLKSLELADNALEHLPAKLFESWQKLEVLNLKNNEWSCDCENQYMIETLLPSRSDKGEDLICAGPLAYKGQNLTSLAGQQLRCLDQTSKRSDRDAAILVGALVSILVAVPLTLAFIIFWRRGFFFCGKQGPATFSRAFYTRADNEEEFM